MSAMEEDSHDHHDDTPGVAPQGEDPHGHSGAHGDEAHDGPGAGLLFYIGLMSTLLILSVLGNFVVILVSLGKKKSRSSTSLMISNLAMSDIFLGGVVLPQKLYGMMHTHDFHDSMLSCAMVTALPVFCILNAIYCLLLMSWERYLAVVKPHLPRFSTRKTVVLLAGVWLTTVLFTIPSLLEYKLDVERSEYVRSFTLEEYVREKGYDGTELTPEMSVRCLGEGWEGVEELEGLEWSGEGDWLVVWDKRNGGVVVEVPGNMTDWLMGQLLGDGDGHGENGVDSHDDDDGDGDLDVDGHGESDVDAHDDGDEHGDGDVEGDVDDHGHGDVDVDGDHCQLADLYVNVSVMEDLNVCRNANSETFQWLSGIFLLLAAYVIPSVVIWVNYGRVIRSLTALTRGKSKQDHAAYKNFVTYKNQTRIVKMLVIVAALFELCWLPYFTLLVYAKVTGDDGSQSMTGPINITRITVSVFSVSYNFYFYLIYNTRFRHALLNMVGYKRGTQVEQESGVASIAANATAVKPLPTGNVASTTTSSHH